MHIFYCLGVCVDGNIRNPALYALPVMPRHYQQNDEISFLKELLGMDYEIVFS